MHRSLCLLVATLAILLSSAPTRADALLYALLDPNDSASTAQRYLANPIVDGIAIRTSWAALEPTEGLYDWNALDALLGLTQNAGKKATLHIIASSYAQPPRWLMQRGIQTYTERMPFQSNRPTQTQPLPWDPQYISAWTRFTAALGQHLRQSGYINTVSHISVAVPVPEMSLFGCRHGIIDNIPYRRDNYLNAWETSIAAMHGALPEVTKLISAPVSQICMPDNDGAAFFGQLWNYSLNLAPDKFSIFAADLNALGSARMSNLGSTTSNAAASFQFIFSYSQDPQNRFKGRLSEAICKATRQYDARYFETYKHDLDNPAVQSDLNLIHHPELCR